MKVHIEYTHRRGKNFLALTDNQGIILCPDCVFKKIVNSSKL